MNLRSGSSSPANTNNEVILSVPINGKSSARRRVVDSSASLIILVVVDASATTDIIVKPKNKIINATLCNVSTAWRSTKASGHRQHSGKAGEGHK